MSSQPPAENDASAERLSRRDFLASATAAAAAAAGLAALPGCTRRKEPELAAAPAGGPAPKPPDPPAPKVPSTPPPMRTLGRTGLKVTIFSLGTIGGVADVLRSGIEHGINFLHCAAGYGTLGQVATATEGRRQKLLLGLKYERAGKVDWEFLNRALEMLKTDHLDILFFPLNSPEEARNRAHLEFFRQVKKQKKARFIGITVHANIAATLEAAIGAGFWDVIMPSYVPDPNLCAALDPLLERAHKRHLGVVAMKTMAGIESTATAQMQTVFKSVLADGNVTAVVKGMLNFEMLNALLVAAQQPLRKAEHAALQQYLVSRGGERCSLCGDCPTCPRGVNVFEVVRNLNYYYAQAGRPEVARSLYGLLPAGQHGGACDDCGACAGKCPQGVSIARHVRAAHLLLG